jgi:hypothetical protein
VDYGYALTGHKSQGQTVDECWVVASKTMDAHATYVALTRHRETVHVYYTTSQFPTFSDLQRSLGSLRPKDLSSDYNLREEKSESWLALQEYQALGRSMALMMAKTKEPDARSFDPTIESLKQERQALARFLLEGGEAYRDDLRQAGLSPERLRIAAGVQPRALSQAEQKAQITVEQYGDVALQCRALWSTIRSTHPGSRASHHPDYKRFDELREERGSLAQVIQDAPLLHGPFVAHLRQEVGYGMRVIQKQAEDAQRRAQRQRSEIQRDVLETLEAYEHHRNHTAEIGGVLKNAPKEQRGIQPVSSEDLLSLYQHHQKARNALAFRVVPWLSSQEISGCFALQEKALGQQAQQHEKASWWKDLSFLAKNTSSDASHALLLHLPKDSNLSVPQGLSLEEFHHRILQTYQTLTSLKENRSFPDFDPDAFQRALDLHTHLQDLVTHPTLCTQSMSTILRTGLRITSLRSHNLRKGNTLSFQDLLDRDHAQQKSLREAMPFLTEGFAQRFPDLSSSSCTKLIHACLAWHDLSGHSPHDETMERFAHHLHTMYTHDSQSLLSSLHHEEERSL